MAYTSDQPFSYGIPCGTYTGRPVSASCFEKDGRLILDVNFAVKNPQTGEWYKKENGYEWVARKRHWLTSKDGGFNEATINGLKEWAKGWNPTSFDDFFWFQLPDVNGVPFGNLAAIGEVELNVTTDKGGNQQIWVHNPNRPKAAAAYRTFAPDGANTDKSALAAKWGTKAKALFAATPKKVSTAAAPSAPQSAPARSAGIPTRPTAKAPAAKPWADYPQTADGAFLFFCAKLEARGEKYASAKHDEEWFGIFDRAAAGKDPDEFTPQDVEMLFQTVDAAFAG